MPQSEPSKVSSALSGMVFGLYLTSLWAGIFYAYFRAGLMTTETFCISIGVLGAVSGGFGMQHGYRNPQECALFSECCQNDIENPALENPTESTPFIQR